MALTIDLEAGLRPPPPPERGTPDGRFVFKKLLGQGAEGLVYLAVPARRMQQHQHQGAQTSACASNRRPQSAVKVVSGGRAYERCRASRGLWPKLVHPNIVFPRESWWDDANRRCFVQMELCQTDLLDLVCDTGALDEGRGSVFAGHLASALVHLHAQGIAHQDVKLENIFVSTHGIAKLGDIGSVVQILPNTVQRDDDEADAAAAAASSRSSGDGRDDSAERLSAEPYTSSSSAFVGSVMYAPPEIVSRSNNSSSSSSSSAGDVSSSDSRERRDRFAADMWALGVSIWSAMAGCHPWELACVHRSNEFRTFVRQGAVATLPMSFSPGLRSLLARLLSLDPRQRPTAAEVLASRWVSPPPTTPPPTSLSSSPCGATIPSWRSAFEPSAHPEESSQEGQQEQQQQQPAPVTPTGTGEESLPLAALHPDGADADADSDTTPGGPVASAAAVAEVASADNAAAAFAAVLQPSPIRSRHRRSKKRKVQEAEEEEREFVERGVALAAPAVLRSEESGCGFVLAHHAERELEQPRRQQAGEGDEAFCPEMNALGGILNGTNGGRGFGGVGGNDASGTGGGGRGERPTKIARVSPSPLTLPSVMMTTEQQQQRREAQRDGDGINNDDNNINGMALSAFFSGLGTRQSLAGFLKAPSPPVLPPAPTETVVRHRIAAAGGQGRRRRGGHRGPCRPVPTSPRAAAAVSGSIWGGGDGTSTAPAAPPVLATSISFTMGERSE